VNENKTYFHHVGEFHAKFHLPAFDPVRPIQINFNSDSFHETMRYRLDFLDEELRELKEAVDHEDIVGVLDALCDLAWVAIGSAHYFNLPFDEAWAEVRRSNLAKELRTEQDPAGKRGAIETIKKPDGWEPPDIRGVLTRHLHRVESYRRQQEDLDRAHDTDLKGEHHES
jgi:predicted HAD superfamily Cof-like phosphohydrolase